jgi:hypothetical protein
VSASTNLAAIGANIRYAAGRSLRTVTAIRAYRCVLVSMGAAAPGRVLEPLNRDLRELVIRGRPQREELVTELAALTGKHGVLEPSVEGGGWVESGPCWT